ncbi:hypothetical protein CDD81_1448 [Ophiocordyceps australis]|uniref:Uncharacterized protein n=1 Tax=Ophiocordyceps australis TaxID=1399860 RepID=A0A2C5YFS2_9HYPO|nr:hypothetical protein CDD81_1448 [Ophiocordyceps australis]
MKARASFSAVFFGLAIANKTVLWSRDPGGGQSKYSETPPIPQIVDQAIKGINVLRGPFKDYPPGGGFPIKDPPGGLPELRRGPKKKSEEPGTPGNPMGPQKKPDRIYPPCGRKRSLCSPINDRQLIFLVDKILEKEFPRLVVENMKTMPIMSNGNTVTAAELSAQFSTNKKSNAIINKKPILKTASKVAGLASVAFYISDVITVYTTNSTEEERRMTAASIIPIAGCGMSYDEQSRVAKSTGLDIAFGLCIASEVALLLGPAAWLFFIIAKPLQLLIQEIEESSLNYLVQKCNSGWDNTFQDMKETFISSRFIDYMQSRYSIDIAAVLYVHSEQTAWLQAGKLAMLSSAHSDDFGTIEHMFDEAWKIIYSEGCSRIRSIETQFQYLVTNSVRAAVTDARNKYYDKFIKDLTDLYEQKIIYSIDVFGNRVPDNELLEELREKITAVQDAKKNLESDFVNKLDDLHKAVMSSRRHIDTPGISLCRPYLYPIRLPEPPSDIRFDDFDGGGTSDEPELSQEEESSPESETSRAEVNGPQRREAIVLRFCNDINFSGQCIQGSFDRGACSKTARHFLLPRRNMFADAFSKVFISAEAATNAVSIRSLSEFKTCRFFA